MRRTLMLGTRILGTPILQLIAVAGALAGCGGGGDLLLPGAGEPATVTLLQGDDQNGRVGEALPQALVAAVKDGANRPVEGASVVFVLSDPAPGASIDPDTAITDADGNATASIVLGTRPGAQSGEVRALGGSGTPTATTGFTLTAISADANGLRALSGDGQSGGVGSTLAQPLVVEVADGFGNPIPGVVVTWTVEGDGAVSEAQTTTGADGLSSVQRTLGATAGTQRTFATVDGLAGSPVVFVHTAVAGTAAGVFIVTGDDQTGPVLTELAADLVVQVRDAANNPVPGVAVTWVVGVGGGGVTPPTSTTDANGQASVTWTLGGVPGPNTVSGVVSGIGIAEFSATATAGAPARLAIRTQPSGTVVSGATLAQQPVLQLLDAQGNEAALAGVSIQAAVASGDGSLGGTTSVLTDGGGRALFTDLSITGAPGRRTLRFSASDFASVTSSPIDVGAAPTVTAITSDAPDPSPVGGEVAVQFSVTSPVGTPGGSVRISDGADSCSGDLTNGSGGCTIALRNSGARTLTAQYQGASGFDTSSDTEAHVVEAPTLSLQIARQPPAGTIGQVLSPGPVVQLLSGGNPSAVPNVDVSATLVSGGGMLAGTTTVKTDAQGRAAFDNLTVDGNPGPRTLVFSAGSYAPVTSASFDVQAAPPSESESSVTSSAATIQAGGSATITVTVRDAEGNALQGRTVTVAAPGDGNLLDPASAVTGSDGIAGFTFTSTAVGVQEITATVDGVTLRSVQVTVDPVPTSTSITAMSPVGSTPAGDSVTVSFAVQAEAGTATGTVTVTSDLDGVSCTAAAPAGSCALQLQTVGTHTLTATYAPTGVFAGSSGTASYIVTSGG